VKTNTSFVDAHEEKLIEKAKGGNEKAFLTLMRKYEQTVYNFSFKVCRNQDKAAETLQDTFIKVFQNLKQFDGKAKFSTWLYSIVTNNCLMSRRRGKLSKASVSYEKEFENETDVHPASVTDWKQTPLDETMTKELRDLLDAAILKLPQDYRVVFVLRDIEDKSAEETARILHISVPAVKSRLRRGRGFFRGKIKGYMTT
jgi:RNA polymerase sigma-70 factor, ECF subfamily